MLYVDATCPLVSKVHVEAERHWRAGREIVLIGHAGHPEVVGTMGQLPGGAIALVETVEDARRFTPQNPENLAFATQTTLSVADTAEIVAALQERFPTISPPHRDDICYATTNRQDAVRELAREADLVLVIGAPNSSNSLRLVEVAKRAGAGGARLVESAADVDWSWFAQVRTLGVSAGASAPENLVEDLLAEAARRFSTNVEEVRVTEEHVVFKLPRILTEPSEAL